MGKCVVCFQSRDERKLVSLLWREDWDENPWVRKSHA